ncbi:unnamed protein product [Notodromas monacha]|uniref:BTB domain-containing protein n=1 Tax=Notodromas monacha TaxID=399045 RepID=A0A7R9BHF3_9CRUS|nr:unnamed protein product [Notodromas monacha]CAG0915289.1 unnamed protein product [Notodromas monacha]
MMESSGIEELGGVSQHMENLLNSRYGADVTVLVQGRRFETHKAILASRSPYFKNLFGDDHKSSPTEVELKDTYADSFKSVLSFLYTGKLDTTKMHVLQLIDIFGLAHRLHLEELVERVEEIMLSSLKLENLVSLWNCVEKVREFLAAKPLRKSPVQVFLACVDWIKSNNINQPDMLLKYLSFKRMTVKELLTIVRPTGYLQDKTLLDIIQVYGEGKVQWNHEKEVVVECTSRFENSGSYQRKQTQRASKITKSCTLIQRTSMITGATEYLVTCEDDEAC